MTSGSQPGAIVAVTKEPARPAPSMAQVTVSGLGQIEGDMAEGSLEVMVLGEESASILLTPSIARGSVLAGTS